ncbi:MAG: endonuclease/exonuclease/phosphatase family protein [Alistipes sp.]|nr:endonuclease/exonuclease/phosphatase family protein [Alistipes sp.]
MKRLLLFAVAVTTIAITTAQELNVASYNIRQHNKKDYKSGNGWTQRVDALCDLIRYNDFDIFGAQEVCHDQLQDMLSRLPKYDYVGVGRDDGATKGEYSPVFYDKERFTLLDSGTFWLSETPDKVSFGWDAACRRVCSWGYFRDKESRKKIWFFNVHMDHKGKVARREGARLIAERINRMCDPQKERVILTGDFNVPQGSEPYEVLAESLRDTYEVAEVRFAPTGTFNGFKPANHTTKRIDHIFISRPLHAERYGILTYHFWSEAVGEASSLNDAPKEISAESRTQRLQSDHYPVQVLLEL